MLPKEGIEEFKKLYKKSFGKELNDVEATRRANNLVAFYRAVLRPSKKVVPEKTKTPPKS
jgi:hypothetical protein